MIAVQMGHDVFEDQEELRLAQLLNGVKCLVKEVTGQVSDAFHLACSEGLQTTGYTTLNANTNTNIYLAIMTQY